MGTRHENARAAQVLGQVIREWPKIRRHYLTVGTLIGLVLARVVDFVTRYW